MPGGAGVLALPSGRLIRGRGLMRPAPDGPDPEFALYVVGSEPFGVPWEFRWVAWPDFGLPSDPAACGRRWSRSGSGPSASGSRSAAWAAAAAPALRSPVSPCSTGCPADQAVDYVRRHYHPDAVETEEQRQFVAEFA